MAKSDVGQQISHWVHDEQACVTVQRIVQTFDLSWSDALSLLKGIPKEGHQYSVTQFASTSKADTDSRNNDRTSKAFRLVKSSLDVCEEPNQTSVWYALALEACTESIHTANEKDLNQFRDGVGNFSIPSSLRPWEKCENEEESEGFASSIFVSEAMKERLAASGKRTADDAFSSQPPIPPKTASARIVPTKKTVTTARNFFSSISTTTSTGKTSASKATTSGTSTTSKGSNKGKTTTPKPKPKPKPKHTSALSFQPRKLETTQSNNNKKTIKPVVNEEKENVQNKSSKVGNADDIVFDEEDSSEEEVEEELVQQPSKSSQQAVKKDASTKKTSSQLEEEDDAPCKDDTTQSKIETMGAPKRRRKRKVMVEKTSVDESGYLYTETQAVWEDVPSSEDEKEPVAAKSKATKQQANKSKKPSAKPKALKQQSLMGFFKKT